MIKWILIGLVTALCTGCPSFSGKAQELPVPQNPSEQQEDTILHLNLPPVYVTPKHKFRSKRARRHYWRLARKVKKVYPYARLAAELLQKYDSAYQAATTKKRKRKYIKQVEKELFSQYGPQLKRLSISEGRILIKLIDRETKHTSYALIKDLKGGLSAFVWQGVARLFGNDLKANYDPVHNQEDRQIEFIIRQMQKS